MYKLNIYTVYTSQHIYTADTHIKTRVNHTHTHCSWTQHKQDITVMKMKMTMMLDV